MTAWLNRVWYQNSPWRLLLYPLSGLYHLGFQLQKKRGLKARALGTQPAVPVIVVGNISVGGTGKTPLTLTLLKILIEHGWHPGVVSRGYGGRPPQLPFIVSSDTKAEFSGDEPLLICRESDCPVVVDPDRRRALSCLIGHFKCDIVVSDDGLQHHHLSRDIEIVVIDGQRGLGNGWCLPAGPLREAPSRLASVDFVVSNGRKIAEAEYLMALKPVCFVQVNGDKILNLSAFSGKSVNAIAGIGNPQRFFEELAKLDINATGQAFADHHDYRSEELDFGDQRPLLMTAKDALKCSGMKLANAWYLKVDAELEAPFETDFMQKVSLFKNCGSG